MQSWNKFDFFAAGGLLAEQLHPLRVGAGAVFLVQHAGQNNDAQMGKFAAHNGQHLQAVHFRHAQVGDQQVKRLRFQHRDGARAGIGDVDLRLAGKLLEQFLV